MNFATEALLPQKENQNTVKSHGQYKLTQQLTAHNLQRNSKLSNNPKLMSNSSSVKGHFNSTSECESIGSHLVNDARAFAEVSQNVDNTCNAFLHFNPINELDSSTDQCAGTTSRKGADTNRSNNGQFVISPRIIEQQQMLNQKNSTFNGLECDFRQSQNNKDLFNQQQIDVNAEASQVPSQLMFPQQSQLSLNQIMLKLGEVSQTYNDHSLGASPTKNNDNSQASFESCSGSKDTGSQSDDQNYQTAKQTIEYSTSRTRKSEIKPMLFHKVQKSNALASLSSGKRAKGIRQPSSSSSKKLLPTYNNLVSDQLWGIPHKNTNDEIDPSRIAPHQQNSSQQFIINKSQQRESSASSATKNLNFGFADNSALHQNSPYHEQSSYSPLRMGPAQNEPQFSYNDKQKNEKPIRRQESENSDGSWFKVMPVQQTIKQQQQQQHEQQKVEQGVEQMANDHSSLRKMISSPEKMSPPKPQHQESFRPTNLEPNKQEQAVLKQPQSEVEQNYILQEDSSSEELQRLVLNAIKNKRSDTLINKLVPSPVKNQMSRNDTIQAKRSELTELGAQSKDVSPLLKEQTQDLTKNKHQTSFLSFNESGDDTIAQAMFERLQSLHRLQKSDECQQLLDDISPKQIEKSPGKADIISIQDNFVAQNQIAEVKISPLQQEKQLEQQPPVQKNLREPNFQLNIAKVNQQKALDSKELQPQTKNSTNTSFQKYVSNPISEPARHTSVRSIERRKRSQRQRTNSRQSNTSGIIQNPAKTTTSPLLSTGTPQLGAPQNAAARASRKLISQQQNNPVQIQDQSQQITAQAAVQKNSTAKVVSEGPTSKYMNYNRQQISSNQDQLDYNLPLQCKDSKITTSVAQMTKIQSTLDIVMNFNNSYTAAVKIQKQWKLYKQRKLLIKGLLQRKRIKSILGTTIEAWRVRRSLNCLGAEVQAYVNSECPQTRHVLKTHFARLFERVKAESLFLEERNSRLRDLQLEILAQQFNSLEEHNLQESKSFEESNDQLETRPTTFNDRSHKHNQLIQRDVIQEELRGESHTLTQESIAYAQDQKSQNLKREKVSQANYSSSIIVQNPVVEQLNQQSVTDEPLEDRIQPVSLSQAAINEEEIPVSCNEVYQAESKPENPHQSSSSMMMLSSTFQPQMLNHDNQEFDENINNLSSSQPSQIQNLKQVVTPPQNNNEIGQGNNRSMVVGSSSFIVSPDSLEPREALQIVPMSAPIDQINATQGSFTSSNVPKLSLNECQADQQAQKTIGISEAIQSKNSSNQLHEAQVEPKESLQECDEKREGARNLNTEQLMKNILSCDQISSIGHIISPPKPEQPCQQSNQQILSLNICEQSVEQFLTQKPQDDQNKPQNNNSHQAQEDTLFQQNYLNQKSGEDIEFELDEQPSQSPQKSIAAVTTMGKLPLNIETGEDDNTHNSTGFDRMTSQRILQKIQSTYSNQQIIFSQRDNNQQSSSLLRTNNDDGGQSARSYNLSQVVQQNQSNSKNNIINGSKVKPSLSLNNNSNSNNNFARAVSNSSRNSRNNNLKNQNQPLKSFRTNEQLSALDDNSMNNVNDFQKIKTKNEDLNNEGVKARVDCWNHNAMSGNGRSSERKNMDVTPSALGQSSGLMNIMTPISYLQEDNNKQTMPFSAQQQNVEGIKQPALLTVVGATDFVAVPIKSCQNKSLNRISNGNPTSNGVNTPKDTRKSAMNQPAIVQKSTQGDVRSPFSVLSNHGRHDPIKAPSALNLQKQQMSSANRKNSRSARMTAMASALANPLHHQKQQNQLASMQAAHRESQESSSTHQRSKSNGKQSQTIKKVSQNNSLKVQKASTSGVTNPNFGLADPVCSSEQQVEQDLALRAQKFFAKVDELKEAMQMMNDLNKQNGCGQNQASHHETTTSPNNATGSQAAQRRAKVKASQMADRKFKKAMKELDTQFESYKTLFQNTNLLNNNNHNVTD